ncbi:MAG: PilZ domain-containing protein [Candidatus Latescibacterota bacterium]
MPGFLVEASHPPLDPLYTGFTVVAVILVVLLVVRLAARRRVRRRQRQANWQGFGRLARSRGCSREQLAALSVVARHARLERPVQLLTSIHVFDRCVAKALEAGALNFAQQSLVESVRRLLVAVPESRERGHDQRQLERVGCALRVGFTHVARGEAEQAQAASGSQTDDPSLKKVLAQLTAGMEPAGAQVLNLSAGGLALMAGNTIGVEEGDYVALSGDAAALPVNLNDLYGQVRTVRPLPERAAQVLHVSFLAIDPAQKRQVIQLVYGQQAGTAGKPPAREAKVPEGGEPKQPAEPPEPPDPRGPTTE